MTMDFSQLHTYTPPQCAPENTGYTYSLSSSYSTAALEFEKEHQIAPVYESPRMSRRSLRLQTSASQYGSESLGDYSQNYSNSSSYTTRRETRSLRSRKQPSSSLSLSLSQVATPRKTLSFSAVSTPINNSGSYQESNTVSDASLHSSILDQSQLRQRTIATTTTTTSVSLDGRWGKSAHTDHSSSNVNGDTSVSKTHTSVANGYICKDCSLHSQEMDTLITRSSSTTSSSSQSADASSGAISSSSPFTSIYSRDRSRRHKTGVLVSMSNTCMRYSKQALAPIVSLITLLYHNVIWLVSRAKSPPGKGFLTSMSDSMRQAVSSSLSQLWLLKQTTLHRMMGYRANGYEGEAHSSFCGSMNVKDLVTEDASHLKLNGSLCDDCKGKQYSETHTILLTQSSRAQRLAGALWSVLAYAGYCLLRPGYCVVRAGKAVGSGAGTLAQKLLSVFWLLLAAPVKAGRGILWFLATGWYRLVSLMCLLNVFFLTRCFPKFWKLLLLLLPLLLLLALWLWGPSTAALIAYLPTINLTEWHPASPFTLLSNLQPASAPVPASVPTQETPLEQTPATPVSQAPPLPPSMAVSTVDLERLERVEHQLALLWERVQQGDQKLERRHGDVLGLYSTLREQLHTQTDRESLELWVSSLLEQKLGVLRGELEQENTERAHTAEEQRQQQESQAARLADLELLLNTLAAKTEEVQQKQQHYEQAKEDKEKEVVVSAPDTAPVSVGVKQEDHDALLEEVKRLEGLLAKVRQDLQGVVACKGKCEQLDTLQETITTQVSSQVRKELQVLFFGSGGSGEEQKELPESLIYWLSQRYVSTPDLQTSLAELELRILRNVSLQLELNRAQTLGEAESQAQTLIKTVTGTVQHTASAEGLTEEQVKLIVQNALRLYSQDRTGLVDYALESGGGSILSTRCSETYETKTALMSLFGLPLWYFSQSPRVVIQPDVYPGNCWAFKGSQGYLVIRLSLRILPTSFCVEHIPKALSPTGNITSAPRNFTVFGLDDEYQEEGKLLGQYIYQEDGESLQTFPVSEQNDKAFQIIEVRVLSNWGHPEYTCLYRFRVHGEPRPQ
ncbi:SUN domain-containing protein 1 isoform X2 [Echeneis naucrates]|uniref:SUN domain-containing protein n=3 Tax=Echeneis naucrates TaxID=173247 RepID=A0A665V452_ECHNA|nr:SUN domain-containing protein 1 isoform X2 [Echeneis naucrates]XP_029363438.1 SUN domain-containing protein 1 isoform X2 [Echeneis naucrates]XP_029363439.1 SUN domain-containing protein 1 isoform X2 [Echeneis naucrates]